MLRIVFLSGTGSGFWLDESWCWRWSVFFFRVFIRGWRKRLVLIQLYLKFCVELHPVTFKSILHFCEGHEKWMEGFFIITVQGAAICSKILPSPFSFPSLFLCLSLLPHSLSLSPPSFSASLLLSQLPLGQLQMWAGGGRASAGRSVWHFSQQW